MRTGSRAQAHGHRQSGFAYLLVLFAVAAIGLALAGAGQVWHTAAQREKEAELLFVGNQFRRAIASYHDASPNGAKQYPLRLEDLLEDPRHPIPRRHLRRLYPDPMTGQQVWGEVRAGGRIVGVHSLHLGSPFKTAFRARDAAFANATRYDQWVFSYDGVVPAPASAPPRMSGPDPVAEKGGDAP